MKTLLPLLLAVSSFALAADESKEPPLNYSLKVGGTSYSIEEGKSFKMKPVSGEGSAILVADEHRVFNYQKVTFKYPRYFAFEVDLSDPASLSWTLSGNHCVVMLFSIEGEITAGEFGELMAGQFGKKNTATEDSHLTLAGKERTAIKLNVSLVGSRLTQEILKLKSPKGRTQLLVIQDTLDDGGKHTEEYTAAMKMIDTSFAEAKPE